MRQHVFADHGQRDLPAGPVEQRQSHFDLEVFDLHRYGRRGELQLFSRANEAQVPGNGGKDA